MDREIITFINENSEYLLLQFVDEHDIEVLENEYKIISESVSAPFSLVAIKVNSWNDELSPWEAPAVFGNQNFGGYADDFKAKKVYLSLGNKEEKTRNQIMATVGDCIRQQAQIFEEKNIPCVLEWNEGNHFRDSDLRTAKAFINLMK